MVSDSNIRNSDIRNESPMSGVNMNKGDFCLIGGLFQEFSLMKFTSGSGSREGAGKILKTISRQLKQRLQIVFASDLSAINVN